MNTVEDEIEEKIKVMAKGCTTTLQRSDANFMQYKALAAALNDKQSQYLWYRSLAKCVSLVSPEKHHQLLASIWSFDWDTDVRTVWAYLDFLIHLNSCHGSTYVYQTLQTFVQKFKDSQIQNPQSPYYDTFHPLVHEGIRRTLAAVPGATPKLYTLLSSEFPHHSADLNIQQAYVHNILTVIEYCPRFREAIFHLLVDKVIQIDVSIKLEEVPDDEIEALFGATSNSQEPNNNNNNEIGWFGECDLEMAEDPAVKQHRENAEKLDAIIDLLLQYIISRSSEREKDEIFEVLIRVFDSLILSTYKSKYTQFIMFYMCRMKEAYVERFLFFLCDKLMRGEASTLTLQSSAAYIGSFVGRATFIPVRITQEVLYRLTQWSHKYVQERGCEGPDAGKHGLFYSICQSAMYIFCFKHEQLVQAPEGLNFIRNLRFIDLLSTNLNPLKLILAEVSLEFDKITRKIPGLPSIASLLKRNESVVLPSKDSWGGDNQLDTFFPFDPYLLRGSSKYFKGAYQFWQSSPEEEEEEEEVVGRSNSESRDRSPPRRRRRNSEINGLSASYDDHTPYGSFSTSMEMSNSWSKGAMGLSLGTGGGGMSFGGGSGVWGGNGGTSGGSAGMGASAGAGGIGGIGGWGMEMDDEDMMSGGGRGSGGGNGIFGGGFLEAGLGLKGGLYSF